MNCKFGMKIGAQRLNVSSLEDLVQDDILYITNLLSKFNDLIEIYTP